MTVDYQKRYDNARPTYTKVNDKKFADLDAGTTVLIPSPKDIEAEINQLDDGEIITFTQLRHRLADRHGADGCCPVMAGMNLRVVAELALEAIDAGGPTPDVVPVWQTVDPSSTLAGKLPGGRNRIAQLRGDSPAA